MGKNGPMIVFGVMAMLAAPVVAEPSVVFEAHPEWVRLRDRTIEYARGNVQDIEGWSPMLSAAARKDLIWQWDSCFMALYAGLLPKGLDGLGNLDNLYRLQSEDGYIGMAYEYATRKAKWGERINPPLYAWVEYLYARRTGDLSRLPRAYDHAARLFRWIKEHRRRANGLYWFEDPGSSGMDNSPRGGYPAANLAGSDLCYVDLAAQQALSANHLAKIAVLIGRGEEAEGWRKEAAEIAGLVNRHHWCAKTGFYHDVFFSKDKRLRCCFVASKTVAGFWPLVAGIAGPEQVAALCAHLENPETFGARHPVPSLSRDDPNFCPDGGYWRGGVWPQTVYMVVAGLRANGRHALAAKIAKRHLTCQAELLGTKEFDSIWECYSPDLAAPARRAEEPRRPYVKPDFVGWSGVGPAVMLVEDAMGLDIDAISKRIVWRLSEPGVQGVRDLPFNGGRLTLMARPDGKGGFSVEQEPRTGFELEIRHLADGVKN